MLMTILIAAGALAPAQAVAPPAKPAVFPVTPVGRSLKDLPNTTITYYDIAGRTGPVIEKSLKKMLADPATANATRLFTYDVKAQIMKATTGQKCTVTSASATLTPTVHLPRLAEEPKVPKALLATWRTYVASVENEAAANLWFISDNLRGVERSIVGLSCDKANPAWNAGLDKLKAQLAAFGAERASAAKKPPGTPSDPKAKTPASY